MRWSLELTPGPKTGTDINPDDVKPEDEFLCGDCGALLAVDHQLWQNSALVGGGLACSVCDAENNPTRGRAMPVPHQ